MFIFADFVLISEKMTTLMIHYLKNKVGVVDFANAAGFCKIYYSHFIFEVIKLLRKIQNHSKKLSNYGSSSKIGRKNHYLKLLKSKNGRKNHYFDVLIQRWEGKTTKYLEILP